MKRSYLLSSIYNERVQLNQTVTVGLAGRVAQPSRRIIWIVISRECVTIFGGISIIAAESRDCCGGFVDASMPNGSRGISQMHVAPSPPREVAGGSFAAHIVDVLFLSHCADAALDVGCFGKKK